MKSKIRPILTALIYTGASLSTACADRIFPAWTQIYDLSVTRSQFAKAVAVDKRGNVAVAGYIIDASSTAALYVAKYDTLNGTPNGDPQGKLIWQKTFRPANGAAIGQGITCDSEGNVIVTGWMETPSNQRDYVTIKFSATDGSVLWQKTYNNSAQNGSDEGMRVAVDRFDNVFVTGRSAGNGTNDDIHTIKYLSDGTFAWERRYNHSGNRNDFPSTIAIDPVNNNVVIAGTADSSSSTTKFYTAKYRNSDGAIGVAGTWEKTYLSTAQGATDMAVDSAGNVIVTGTAYVSSNFDKDIHTIKYQAADGAVLWSRDYATSEPTTNWSGVAVDHENNVFITGTSAVGINGRRIYTAKYSGTNGAIPPLWEKYSPGLDFDDEAKGIAVDPAGTVVVVGRSNSTDTDLQNEFYIARYGGTEGETREEFSFNANDSGGDDIPVGIAMDSLGGFAVAGTVQKPRASNNLFYNAIATIKFNRLLAVTGDPATGTGVPANAKLASIYTPALANDGGVAARVTIAAGKTKLGGIFAQESTGTPEIIAVQGAAAPGTPAATYKSFLDPAMSQNGRLAFLATVQGTPGKPSVAVFSDVTGTLTRHLQQGQPVPNLPTGTVLKSVSGISIRGSGFTAQVVVLATLSGPDINKTNNVALLGINAFGTVTQLLRTGNDLTVDGSTSKITSIVTLTGAKGSAGHGRWQSDTRIAARVTLADKRTAHVLLNYAGTAMPLLSTGRNASLFANEAKWQTLGLPSVGSSLVSATLGSAAGANVAKNADSGIVYTTDANTFNFVAREGNDAHDVSGAKYASLGEPVVSLGNEVAFMATLTGTGVKPSNKQGIWAATFTGQLQEPSILARQGDMATDVRGDAGTTPWTSFLSLAYPGGANSGPIFLAKVAGKKNNFGLWAQDSCSKLRQAVRVGDYFGDQLLTSVTLLQGTAGVTGATRSFNNTAAVGTLLKFKDKTQAIYYLGIP